MGREEEEDRDKPWEVDTVSVGLEKLEVSIQWNTLKKELEQREFNPENLWLGRKARATKPKPAERSPKATKTKRRKCRKLPYSVDVLPSMDQLSFSQETCHHRLCRCNEKGSKRHSDPLNYATACSKPTGSSQKLIREAKLKLHNKTKDQQTVLRAARLKIHKSTENPVGGRRLPSPLKKIFGSESTKALQNFASIGAPKAGTVENQSKPSKGKSSSFCSGVMFDGYLSSGQTASASSLSSASSSTNSCDKNNSCSRLAPDRGKSSKNLKSKKRPCSCSQEALLEDFSVDELAGYFEDFVHIPKKMSTMAEMMYT